MASAISNTHATIFTKLPKCITKIWSPRIINTTNESVIQNELRRHESCMVESIEIKVTFRDVPQDDTFEIDEYGDTTNDMIQMWQEGKLQWELIDKAVAQGVKELQASIVTAAQSRKVESVTVPRPSRTIYTNQTASTVATLTKTNLTRNNDDDKHVVGYAETIAPTDSTSNAGIEDIARQIRHEIRRQSQKRTSGTKEVHQRNFFGQHVRDSCRQ